MLKQNCANHIDVNIGEIVDLGEGADFVDTKLSH